MQVKMIINASIIIIYECIFLTLFHAHLELFSNVDKWPRSEPLQSVDYLPVTSMQLHSRAIFFSPPPLLFVSFSSPRRSTCWSLLPRSCGRSWRRSWSWVRLTSGATAGIMDTYPERYAEQTWNVNVKHCLFCITIIHFVHRELCSINKTRAVWKTTSAAVIKQD